jgi:hypothetical protein
MDLQMGKDGGKTMNEGVKILIERIKTNPEEFTHGSKWAGIIHGYKAYLSKEDAQALDDAYNGLMQQTFTEKVMKELLAPEEDDSLGKWFTAQANVTHGAGMTLGRASAVSNNVNTVTLTNQTNGATGTWGTSSIQLAPAQHDSTVAHMKAHLEAHKEFIKTTPVKKHKTLFGKLFNYS